MKKTCWHVHLPGKSFPMVSTEPLTHDEALEFARGIWPDCIVE